MQCDGHWQPVACYGKDGGSGQAAKHWAVVADEVSGVAVGFVCLQIKEIGEITPVWGVSTCVRSQYLLLNGPSSVVKKLQQLEVEARQPKATNTLDL